MNSVLDTLPFPPNEPDARELVRILAALYPTPVQIAGIASDFGVDTSTLPLGASSRDLWWSGLFEIAKHGGVRQIVETAVQQFPKNPSAAFLKSLLANGKLAKSAEPIPGANETPAFDDGVSEPEALLFYDDLTMPVGKVPTLISTLKLMTELAPAVCLLRVSNAYGSYFGTGFRCAPTAVLTNHHVLYPKEAAATAVQIDFNFDVDASGSSLPVKSTAGDVSSMVGEAGDDWALIKAPDLPAEIPQLDIKSAAVPAVGEMAYILQHPGGQQRRLGFVRNMISDVDDRTVKYLTDTQPGSSGSPVFNSHGKLIALHHAGGRAFEVAGRPPVAKNEGIRLTRILERVLSKGIEL